DVKILATLARTCNQIHIPGIIKIHYVRIMRSGSYHFIDAHVVVPEFWEVLHAHDEINQFERKLIENHPYQAEIHFHLDPCRKAFCAHCDLPSCPVRQKEFVNITPYTVDELTARQAAP